MFRREELEILLYIAEKERAPLNEVVDVFSRKFNVSRQMIYYIINKLVRNNVLTKKYIGKGMIMLEFHTKFLLFMEKMFQLIYSSKSWYYDRIRKARKKEEKKGD